MPFAHRITPKGILHEKTSLERILLRKIADTKQAHFIQSIRPKAEHSLIHEKIYQSDSIEMPGHRYIGSVTDRKTGKSIHFHVPSKT